MRIAARAVVAEEESAECAEVLVEMEVPGAEMMVVYTVEVEVDQRETEPEDQGQMD